MSYIRSNNFSVREITENDAHSTAKIMKFSVIDLFSKYVDFSIFTKKFVNRKLNFRAVQKGQQFSGRWFFLWNISLNNNWNRSLVKTLNLLKFILNNSNAFSFRKEAVCISYFLPSGVDLQQDTSALCPVNIFFSLPSYVSYGFISRTTCSKVLYLIAVLENFAKCLGKWPVTQYVTGAPVSNFSEPLFLRRHQAIISR